MLRIQDWLSRLMYLYLTALSSRIRAKKNCDSQAIRMARNDTDLHNGVNVASEHFLSAQVFLSLLTSLPESLGEEEVRVTDSDSSHSCFGSCRHRACLRSYLAETLAGAGRPLQASSGHHVQRWTLSWGRAHQLMCETEPELRQAEKGESMTSLAPSFLTESWILPGPWVTKGDSKGILPIVLAGFC